MADREELSMIDKYYQYHLLFIPRGIKNLEKLGECKKYPKNYMLNDQETVPEYCYVVKSGRVICFENSIDGEQRLYNIMEPGSMVMEEFMLFDFPCPVQFMTMEPCELIKIHKCDLKRAFKQDIDVVLDVVQSQSMKFVSAMEQLRLGPRQSADWKICKMLLIFVSHYGSKQPDGSYILDKRISQQRIADILAMNRVTVTRKLKELKNLGYLENSGGYYRFPDVAALEKYIMTLGSEEEL